MKKRRHFCRIAFLLLFPAIMGVIIACIICTEMKSRNVKIDAINMIEVAKTMIGVWGTLLGFIITAESILVAFSNGTITGEFKQTGHYMTVIFQYTQTSIKLLVYIFAFVCIISLNKFSIVEMFLFILFSVMTFIDVFISFFILILMLKMSTR